jgi:hypothetical protein
MLHACDEWLTTRRRERASPTLTCLATRRRERAPPTLTCLTSYNTFTYINKYVTIILFLR